MNLSVVLSGRNNPTDAAAWFCDIAVTSRDQMDMGVEYRLTGITTAVESEIKAGD